MSIMLAFGIGLIFTTECHYSTCSDIKNKTSAWSLQKLIRDSHKKATNTCHYHGNKMEYYEAV